MRSTAAYHAARLTSYALVGALAGSLGAMPLGFFHHGAGLVLPWLLVLVFIAIGIGVDRWMPVSRCLLAKPLRKVQLAAYKLPGTSRAALCSGSPRRCCPADRST
jgi:sulfite exporter TauE/SafE